MRQNALDLQVRYRVRKAVSFYVDYHAIVAEKIGTQDGILHICNDENPTESVPKAEVKREGTFPVSRYCCVLLTAWSPRPSCRLLRSVREGGSTLTSASVSTRKRRRLDCCWPGTLVAASDRPGRFPIASKAVCTSVRRHRSVGGTSRGQSLLGGVGWRNACVVKPSTGLAS